MVGDRSEVCDHVRKSVYGPRPSYGHLMTERLTHSDFQGHAAPQGLFKVAVHPPRKEDSALIGT